MRDGEGDTHSENCLQPTVLSMNRHITVSYRVRREPLLLDVVIKKNILS